jgi:hypothetical protein
LILHVAITRRGKRAHRITDLQITQHLLETRQLIADRLVFRHIQRFSAQPARHQVADAVSRIRWLPASLIAAATPSSCHEISKVIPMAEVAIRKKASSTEKILREILPGLANIRLIHDEVAQTLVLDSEV